MVQVGVDPDAVPPPPEGGTGLHPSVAPLRKLYALPTAASAAEEGTRFDAARDAEEPGEPIKLRDAVLAEWRRVISLRSEP